MVCAWADHPLLGLNELEALLGPWWRVLRGGAGDESTSMDWRLCPAPMLHAGSVRPGRPPPPRFGRVGGTPQPVVVHVMHAMHASMPACSGHMSCGGGSRVQPAARRRGKAALGVCPLSRDCMHGLACTCMYVCPYVPVICHAHAGPTSLPTP